MAPFSTAMTMPEPASTAPASCSISWASRSRPRGEDGGGGFGESCARPPPRDPGRIGRELLPAHGAHADGVVKSLEHGRVVLAVAQIADRIVLDVAKHPARHGEL